MREAVVVLAELRRRDVAAVFGHLRELLVHEAEKARKTGEGAEAGGQKAQVLPMQPQLRALLPAQGTAFLVLVPAEYAEHQGQDGHIETQAVGQHVEGAARGFAIAQPAAVRALHIKAQQPLARRRTEKVQAERLEQQHEHDAAHGEGEVEAEARKVNVRPENQHDGCEQQQLQLRLRVVPVPVLPSLGPDKTLRLIEPYIRAGHPAPCFQLRYRQGCRPPPVSS